MDFFDGELQNDQCTNGDGFFGCTVYCDKPPEAVAQGYCNGTKALRYPYASGTITIGMEGEIKDGVQQGYLQNVIVRETDPQLYHPTALAAQAVAARTFAYWHIDWNRIYPGTNPIDNSASGFQVYIPYAYDAMPQAARTVVDTALAKRYYMSYSQAYTPDVTINGQRNTAARATDEPIFAQFNAESTAYTIAEPSGQYPYMVGTVDPVSSHPALVDQTPHQGLIQRAASRWANGSLYAAVNDAALYPEERWSVTWEDARQILTHYYTNIHVRDANAGNALKTPAYRWAPLQITWATGDGQAPTTLCIGSVTPVVAWIQNTGTETWVSGGPITFSYREFPGQEVQAADVGYAYPLQPVAPGATYTATLFYQPAAATAGDIVAPHFDMVQGATPFRQVEPDQPWPDYLAQITLVNCALRAYLPFVLADGVVAVSQ